MPLKRKPLFNIPFIGSGRWSEIPLSDDLQTCLYGNLIY